MTKIDLKDVTFTIPIRYDTDHRIENVNLIVDFLHHHFDTNIMVMEESAEKKFEFLQNKNVNYIFSYTTDPNFHRTKCLNEMSKRCATPIIVNYDADVLFKVVQYTTAVDYIRNGTAEMVFPYEGKFMECNRDKYFNKINEMKAVYFIDENDLGCNHPNSAGGAIFWNLDTFKRIGMENENFKSWGWEDNERLIRAQKLGVKIIRTSGILYHMSHDRCHNSTPSNDCYNQNRNEFNKVNSMSTRQLESYIKTWSWVS